MVANIGPTHLQAEELQQHPRQFRSPGLVGDKRPSPESSASDIVEAAWVPDKGSIARPRTPRERFLAVLALLFFPRNHDEVNRLNALMPSVDLVGMVSHLNLSPWDFLPLIQGASGNMVHVDVDATVLQRSLPADQHIRRQLLRAQASPRGARSAISRRRHLSCRVRSSQMRRLNMHKDMRRILPGFRLSSWKVSK